MKKLLAFFVFAALAVSSMAQGRAAQVMDGAGLQLSEPAPDDGMALVVTPGPVALWGRFTFHLMLSPLNLFPDTMRFSLRLNGIEGEPTWDMVQACKSVLPMVTHEKVCITINKDAESVSLITNRFAAYFWFHKPEQVEAVRSYVNSHQIWLQTWYGWATGQTLRYIVDLER